MANTYTLIASTTVGSGGTSSIDFTSIPQTYTDLIIKMSARTDYSYGPTDLVLIKFNGTSTNLSSTVIYGYPPSSQINSFRDTVDIYIGATSSDGATANTFGNVEIYIPNYTSSNKKPISGVGVSENNNINVQEYVSAGLWSSTAAITSIQLVPYDGLVWNEYSTVYLYGIKNS